MQWNPTLNSTAWIFFSFTRIFQNTFRNIPYNFFFMLFSSFQNNYCKNLEIREGRQEQWNSTCTAWNFFLSFTRIFLYTFRNIPYNFLLCGVRVSRIRNVKKSRKPRGKTRAMESHFYTIDFFSHENFPMNIQREDKVQHVLYGMRKRPSHGKSVPRKQRPTHVKRVRGASSDAPGAPAK